MNAEILSIGTELLLGEIVDTNSTHIARSLRDIGVNIFYMATVGDNMERIKDNLLMCLSRSDLVITTGGLGPTIDDVTRQAVAAAVGRELVFHQDLLDQIAERFARFGAHMSENNRLQAYIPRDAIIIENPVGTAPCYIVEDEKGTIISLPGVPSEMKYILEHSVVPYLKDKMGGVKIIKARILRTAGIGESHLDEQIAEFMTYTNPTVGLAAHTGQTDVRLTVRADSDEEAVAMLDELEAKIREKVGRYIFAVGKIPLQNALVDILKRHDKHMNISETGTGENLRTELSAVPGGTEVLAHSIQYPDVATLRQAHAELGPDSDLEILVKAEAQHILTEDGSDIAIAVATHDAGTAIAVNTAEKALSRVYSYGGEATHANIWAGTWGMSLAWRILKEIEEETEE